MNDSTLLVANAGPFDNADSVNPSDPSGNFGVKVPYSKVVLLFCMISEASVKDQALTAKLW